VKSATAIATTTRLGMHAACFVAVIVRAAADGSVKKFEQLRHKIAQAAEG